MSFVESAAVAPFSHPFWLEMVNCFHRALSVSGSPNISGALDVTANEVWSKRPA